MKHEYDLFEKFPDGSSLWRDSVPGFETPASDCRNWPRDQRMSFMHSTQQPEKFLPSTRNAMLGEGMIPLAIAEMEAYEWLI